MLLLVTAVARRPCQIYKCEMSNKNNILEMTKNEINYNMKDDKKKVYFNNKFNNLIDLINLNRSTNRSITTNINNLIIVIKLLK